jgi:hypothetical protein
MRIGGGVGPIVQIDFDGDIETALQFRDWIRSGDYLKSFAEWCVGNDK